MPGRRRSNILLFHFFDIDAYPGLLQTFPVTRPFFRRQILAQYDRSTGKNPLDLFGRGLEQLRGTLFDRRFRFSRDDLAAKNDPNPLTHDFCFQQNR